MENSCSNVQKHKTEADAARDAGQKSDPQEADGESQCFTQEMLFKMHGLDMTLPASCDFCPEKFSDWDSFDAHMPTHRECLQFACQLCNNTYVSWSNLMAHRKAYHHGEVLSCESCGELTFHPDSASVYFSAGLSPVGCEECGEGFNTLVQLYKHYYARHEGKVGEVCVCPTCSAVFPTPKQLAFHVTGLCYTCNDCQAKFCAEDSLEDHDCPQFLNHTCVYCDKVLRNAFSLRHYENSHISSYSCDQCPRVLPSKSKLDHHMASHVVHCAKCSRQFAAWRDLVEHVEVTHADPGEQLTCHVCGQSPARTDFLVHYEACLKAKRSARKLVQRRTVAHESLMCEYCGRRYDTRSQLLLHVIRHTGQREHSCAVCGQGFYSSRELVVHHRRHTGERPFACSKCPKAFSSASNLAVHRKTHDKVAKYACPHCDKTFAWKSVFVGHVRLHTGERPYQCSLCPSAFPLKKRLNFHMKYAANHSAVSCDVCHENFATEDELDAHCKEQCCFSCDKCPRTFRRQAALDLHMTRHVVQCVQCRRQFAAWGDLQRHLEVTHADPDEQLTCPVCGQSPARTDFLVHYESCLDRETSSANKTVKRRLPSGRFVCEYCGRVYRFKMGLEAHMLRHSGVRPYRCKLCDKAFYSKARLVVHIRGHTGERPYVCEFCAKTFADRCTLLKHIKVHNNVKPYTCRYCDKKFAWHTNYVGHVRQHTGERPYHCGVCYKEFVLVSRLNAHMKKRCGWNCSDCGGKFADKEALTAHQCSGRSPATV